MKTDDYYDYKDEIKYTVNAIDVGYHNEACLFCSIGITHAGRFKVIRCYDL